jgi:GntR family transcriptional regulator, transcriptional repressor for pyruvate dehydrogenase complex
VSADGIFTEVTAGRVSAEIVEQVERAIEFGQLEVGDRLPSERELTARFGVSRVTVRDALRILEANGLIEIRLGSRGGAYVTAPQPSRIGSTLARLLMLADVAPEELEEARHVLEMMALEFAVKRATSDDIAQLRAICDRTEAAIDAGRFDIRYSVEFHVRLAEAGNNRALSLLFASFQNAVLLTLLRARDSSPAHGLRGLSEHRALIDAIEARDLLTARQVMEGHLERTAGAIRARQKLVDRTEGAVS